MKYIILALMGLAVVAGVSYSVGQYHPATSAIKEVSIIKEKADCEAQGGLFQYQDMATDLRINGHFLPLYDGWKPTMSCIKLEQSKTLWSKEVK